MADGSLYTVFVNGSPTLPLPVLSTDEIAIVRGGVTYKIPPASIPGFEIVTMSETPPVSPGSGALWWDSAGGQLYVYYEDVDSSQWVPATNQSVAPPIPALVLAPASGATVILADATPVYIDTALLATLTIRLPVPEIGTSVEICFRSPITALTLVDSGGGAIVGVPTSAFGPGAAIEMRFDTPGWIYWK